MAGSTSTAWGANQPMTDINTVQETIIDVLGPRYRQIIRPKRVRNVGFNALEGLVLKCQTSALPGPELGIVINDSGRFISMDLCWP